MKFIDLLLEDSGSIKTININTNSFNTLMKKNGLNDLKSDYNNDIKEINENVARRYISFISQKINKGDLAHIDWDNKSKDPQNLFQLTGHLEGGNSIWACFVYVDDSHKVVKGEM